MYYIIEIQKNENGVGSALVTTKENRNEADSEYYRVMQYAAISEVPIHGAIIIDEYGTPILHSAYEHIPEPEEAEVQ